MHTPTSKPGRLVLTRGYPGSGKTTWAQRQEGLSNTNARRVNRDDIRSALFDTFHGLTREQEEQVTDVQHAAARDLLRQGRTVLIDDTNLNPDVASAWKALAAGEGARFVVVDVTTPVAECIRRDAARGAAGGRTVGANVVRMFAERYPMPWPALAEH